MHQHQSARRGEGEPDRKAQAFDCSDFIDSRHSSFCRRQPAWVALQSDTGEGGGHTITGLRVRVNTAFLRRVYEGEGTRPPVSTAIVRGARGVATARAGC